MIMKVDKQLFMPDQFLLPRSPVNCLKLLEIFAGKIEAAPIDGFIVGRPADRRLLALRAPANAVDDPFQDPHILAEARPKEPAFAVLAEPVDVEDARRYR